MAEDVRGRVVAFMIDNYLFGDDSGMPGDDESLMETGVIDSTGILELVDFLEGDIGIKVSDDETVPANLDSVNNIVAFVATKQR